MLTEQQKPGQRSEWVLLQHLQREHAPALALCILHLGTQTMTEESSVLLWLLGYGYSFPESQAFIRLGRLYWQNNIHSAWGIDTLCARIPALRIPKRECVWGKKDIESILCNPTHPLGTQGLLHTAHSNRCCNSRKESATEMKVTKPLNPCPWTFDG